MHITSRSSSKKSYLDFGIMLSCGRRTWGWAGRYPDGAAAITMPRAPRAFPLIWELCWPQGEYRRPVAPLQASPMQEFAPFGNRSTLSEFTWKPEVHSNPQTGWFLALGSPTEGAETLLTLWGQHNPPSKEKRPWVPTMLQSLQCHQDIHS